MSILTDEKKNWEFGSFFDFETDWFEGEGINIFNRGGYYFYNSGRAAALKIIEHHLSFYPEARVLLPAYFCSDVFEFLEDHDCKYELYNDHPLQDSEEFFKLLESKNVEKTDLIFVVDYFGLREIKNFQRDEFNMAIDFSHSIGKEDEKHSYQYSFGSLRKEFPFPDGGWLYTKHKENLQVLNVKEEPFEAVAERRLLAQFMKSLYLTKGMFSKDRFLEIYRETEEAFENLSVAGISQISRDLIERVAWSEFEEKRQENLRFFHKEWYNFEFREVELLSDDTSYCICMLFPSFSVREYYRQYLIQNDVYPFILWPLYNDFERSFPKAYEVSQRLLCLHADVRYDSNDIEKVLEIMSNAHSIG